MRFMWIMAGAISIAVGLTATRAWPQTPLGTAFTYQGQLKQGGVPVNGTIDIQFTLWDASVDGDVLDELDFVDVDVENGLFTVPLDFGEEAYSGNALWLEVSVRFPSGEGDYTLLGPRQQVTPTPYALALPGLRTQQNDTSPNLIGGWENNTVAAGVVGATISGGGATDAELLPNRATDNYGTIGGGVGNVAGNGNEFADDSSFATVGGGRTNMAYADYATVSGGDFNVAGGREATVGGGKRNVAGAEGSADAASYATVSGGGHNVANSWAATVGGGYENAALGGMSTAPGGWGNVAGGLYSFAAGKRARVRTADEVGGDDTDGDEGTFVWSDSTTHQSGYFTSTGPNQFLIRATGGVGIGTNQPAADLDIWSDRNEGTALHLSSATASQRFIFQVNGSIPAGEPNRVGNFEIWTSGWQGNHNVFTATPDGRVGINMLQPTDPLTVGGVIRSTSGGFECPDGSVLNSADGANIWAKNDTSAYYDGGNVGVGTSSPASRIHATDTQTGEISYPLRLSNEGNAAGTAAGMLFQVDSGAGRGKGGFAYERKTTWNRGDLHFLQNNSANTDAATLDDAVMTIKNAGWIGMGTTTPAAQLDLQSDNIVWTGFNIKNLNSDQRYLIQVNGTQPGVTRAGNLEIWGSGAGGNHNVFTATSNGNVGIRNQAPLHPLQIGTTSANGNQAHLTAGGVWTNGSDRNSKRNFQPVDRKSILAKVVELPVTKWRYKGEDNAIHHIGPVAQDFHAAFGLGGSDKHIGTLDADGVALAAIQGLYDLVKEKNAELEGANVEKDAQIAAQRERIAHLSARLERIEAMLGGQIGSSKGTGNKQRNTREDSRHTPRSIRRNR